MRRTSVVMVIFVAVSVLAVASSAHAALFIKFGGIEGESVEVDHKGWSDIYSVEWGVKMAPGPSLEFRDLSWIQTIDKSIPKLFDALTSGQAGRSADVDFTTHTGEEGLTYFRMSFQDVAITELNLTCGSEGRPNIAGSFSYGFIEMTYYILRPDGSLGPSISAEYDLRTGRGDVGSLAYLYGLGTSGPTTVPIPAALWLFGSGVAALIGLRRNKK